MTEISGNPELDEDPYRLTVIVKDTKNFTLSELALTTAVAVKSFVPEASQMIPESNWDVWRNGRFGKLMRRLKPALFERMAASTDGYLYTEGDVTVFVVEPLRRSQLPSLVKKGQVAGLTVLPEVATPKTLKAPPISKTSQMFEQRGIKILINSSLDMSASKASIAAAHALQLLRDDYYSSKYESLREVFDNSSIEIVFEKLSQSDMYTVVIRDAGLTEVEPGSVTAAAYLN